MAIRWGSYKVKGLHDELIRVSGRPRPAARALCDYLRALKDKDIEEYRAAAETAIHVMGITFTVYSEEEGSIDRAWPFDIIPRIIDRSEWQQVEAGLRQRVQALNLFIDDLYHKQQIVRDEVFPEALLKDSKNFRPQCVGIDPPHGVWAHICGSDLVRDSDGTIYVLEDNLRVPSGVSYMLENRQIMKRVFPELFENYNILPVDDYPSQLYDMLASLAPRGIEQPEIVVLTPGIYNSAYFEHAYLAQQMGAELVEGSDLVVDKHNMVYMRTIEGLSQVDVIYRRIDDLFLDPEAFAPDSMLGVPGLMRAWKAGNVALANAPGAGVADDKVVYSYVPEIIRYYLNEEPLIDNVPTYRCFNKTERDYVIQNIAKLVVKPANESGGYGMLIGPQATQEERDKFVNLIRRDPRNYIAQPLLTLSTAPTLVGNRAEPRHLDLRPFILSGEKTYVTTGGLTRVALRKGSTVVNSSQGGGSKDTWIVDMESGQ
ncbi:circularly permuted type 2 ATP-grasp protein [Thiohalophilus thiocyanatoxydans]|uniref:Putative circularly permuted ATP-grasp superfamily protein n=1 Tax=Thiohalophilus thiocyanatoxydans TaxID=381308 RepID=A0A4V3H4S6_9GAMM|nr:circularly permuted type 2 ATP-grasp protein [Thiohalophilus thiocyanatoxydans]TDY04305.1 putative circularly permuted ATP-grasp superfamily protein [Thiohalophilus thiocyanatoxydans]